MRMHTARRLATHLAPGALAALIACASPPAALDEARSAYQEAAADPAVRQDAPVALYEAEKALREAEEEWEDDEDRDETAHLARLAQKRVELARVRAERQQAQSQIERLAEERDAVLVAARTREVETAMDVAGRAQAELREALRELEPRETERGLVLTLGDVLFAFDRAELKPGAEQSLKRLVDFLKENPERGLLVEGHTDSVGSDAYNLELSRRRAEAVRRFLAANGVAPQRLVVRGYGEAYPRVANESPAARQMNRRVEIVVLEPGESPERLARQRGATPVPAALETGEGGSASAAGETSQGATREAEGEPREGGTAATDGGDAAADTGGTTADEPAAEADEALEMPSATP